MGFNDSDSLFETTLICFRVEFTNNLGELFYSMYEGLLKLILINFEETFFSSFSFTWKVAAYQWSANLFI